MKDKLHIRGLFNVTRGGLVLGTGQAIARIASLALVAYLARRLSTRAFGELILAQAMARYVNIGTDMGSKFIGARLIAKAPDATTLILPSLQRKRLILSIVSVGLAVLYALKGPVLPFAREFLVLFSLSLLPYGLSIDWVAWGLKRFLPMASWQITIALLSFVGTVIFLELFESHLLDWIAVANGLALLGGATVVWAWWIRVGSKQTVSTHCSESQRKMVWQETRWSPVLVLGLAAAFNVIFQCLDVLLLAGLSSAEQVAQYGAAYKVLNVILSSFWLFTTAAYPFLANVRWSRRAIRFLALALVGLGLAGIAVAGGLRHFASPLTTLLFGYKFDPAAELLRVLALAIPLDFVAASCGTVLVSSGRNFTVTIGMMIGVVTNLALNVIWIRHYGALGAARATVVSYIVVVCLLAIPSLWRTSANQIRSVELVPAPPETAD